MGARMMSRAGIQYVALQVLVAVAMMPAQALADQQRASVPTPLRGLVKSVHQASLTSDINTPISEIGFREGQRFQRGDRLVVFDCNRQRHELAALAAQVREMEVSVESNRYLDSNGAGNRSETAVAEARLARAHAEWSALEYRLRGCEIVAPFDGVVTDLTINPHEIPQPGRPFLVIAGHEALEIEIIIPSRLIPALGDRVIRFAIDETGRIYAARVVRSGGVVDPVSQTLKVYAVFEGQVAGVLPGMSGTAELAAHENR